MYREQSTRTQKIVIYMYERVMYIHWLIFPNSSKPCNPRCNLFGSLSKKYKQEVNRSSTNMCKRKNGISSFSFQSSLLSIPLSQSGSHSHLQALRVVCIRNRALVWRNADGTARPALAATLSVMSDGATRGRGGGGCRGRRGLDSRRRRGWIRGRSSRATGKGRANLAILDVRVRDVGIGSASLDIGGRTRGGGTRATGDAGLGGVGASRVVRVEPEHVDGVVVPDGEHKDHAGLEGVAHGREAALGRKGVGVAKLGLLRSAEVVGDGVAGRDVGHVDVGVGNDFAVLDVLAANLLKVARSGAGVGDELGDDGKDFARVDGLADAVERLVAHAVRVEVAASLVAGGGARSARAGGRSAWGAGVWGIGRRHHVGFPNVHLRAARAERAFARVGAVGVGSPSSNVGLERISTSAKGMSTAKADLAADEFEVMGALRVAVARPVVCTSLIVGLGRHATISSHLRKVESAVETARQC